MKQWNINYLNTFDRLYDLKCPFCLDYREVHCTVLPLQKSDCDFPGCRFSNGYQAEFACSFVQTLTAWCAGHLLCRLPEKYMNCYEKNQQGWTAARKDKKQQTSHFCRLRDFYRKVVCKGPLAKNSSASSRNGMTRKEDLSVYSAFICTSQALSDFRSDHGLCRAVLQSVHFHSYINHTPEKDTGKGGKSWQSLM